MRTARVLLDILYPVSTLDVVGNDKGNGSMFVVSTDETINMGDDDDVGNEFVLIGNEGVVGDDVGNEGVPGSSDDVNIGAGVSTMGGNSVVLCIGVTEGKTAAVLVVIEVDTLGVVVVVIGTVGLSEGD